MPFRLRFLPAVVLALLAACLDWAIAVPVVVVDIPPLVGLDFEARPVAILSDAHDAETCIVLELYEAPLLPTDRHAQRQATAGLIESTRS